MHEANAKGSFFDPDPFPAPFDFFASLGDLLPLPLPLPLPAFGPVLMFMLSAASVLLLI